MYAIWFLFEKNDEKYISEIIAKLAKQYNSPIFTPHVTAYGLINAEFELINETILDTIYNIKSLNITKKSIAFSNDFWKTLFIDFNLNLDMLKIQKHLAKNLSKYSKYEFKPHASLIYKKMQQEEKEKLSNNIKIKNDFNISGIGIQKFSKCIKEWKIVQRYHL
jgi:2'-5' RNA ligase